MIDLCEPDTAVADAILIANADWRVVADGLEHRDTGYFIARAALGARLRDGLWAWPLQLAEKSWCTPRSFRDAFTRALDLFGIARDEHLARSFAVGSDVWSGSRRPGQDGFVALGAVVRPRSSERKRPYSSEARAAAARRMPAQAGIASASRS